MCLELRLVMGAELTGDSSLTSTGYGKLTMQEATLLTGGTWETDDAGGNSLTRRLRKNAVLVLTPP